MSKRYRILFRGKIQEGYDAALVRKLAAFRLDVSLATIERLFSGRKFFIKGNLPSEEVANRYVAEFAKLGMIVWAEPERTKPWSEKSHTITESASAETKNQGDLVFRSGYLTHPATRRQHCAECPLQTTKAVREAFDSHKTAPNVALAEQILRLKTSLNRLHRVRESGWHVSSSRACS